MSTDRELLENAAKAAGFTLQWPTDPITYAVVQGVGPRRTDTWDTWNPLTDDADAFRLAVALRIKVKYHETLGQALVWFGAMNEELTVNVEDCGRDEAAATRRAVVRAAAAMAHT